MPDLRNVIAKRKITHKQGEILVRTHNKAVRDNIPDIIKKSGKTCTIKQLDDMDFLAELEKKLYEEINEYMADRDIEELADILEVIYRIAELKGYPGKDMEKIRMEKRVKTGCFSRNLYLFETSD